MKIISRYLMAVLVIAFFSQSTFAQTGHVGVGEEAPEARLHVTQSDPSAFNGILGFFQRSGAGDVGLSFSQKNVSSYSILHPAGGGLAFYKDRSPSSPGILSMHLSNDGNLFLPSGRSLYIGEQTNLGGAGLRFHHALNRGWIDYSGPFGLHFRINQGDADATRMFIRSLDGHVGIGTINPTEKLTVISPNSNTGIANFQSSGGWGEIYVGNGTNWVDLGVDDNIGWVGTRFPGNLVFRTSTTPRMAISGTNGDVGIGTLTPVNKLDVAGGFASGSAYSGTYVAPADGAIIQGMVGVGTHSPQKQLHVAGNGDVELMLESTSTNGGKWTLQSNPPTPDINAQFQIIDRKAERARLAIDALGRVGIGTVNPANSLDVEGGVAIGAAYSGTSTAPADGALIQGHVGIGTINPTEKLTVISPNSNTGIANFQSSGGWGEIYVGNGTNWVDLGVDDNVGWVGTRFAGNLVFRTSTTPRMAISGTNGDVGIGTLTPVNKLDVEGGVAIGAAYSGTSTAPADGAIIEGKVGIGTTSPANSLDVEGGVAIGAAYSGTSTAPADGALIQGHVGIGTTNAVEKLTVMSPLTNSTIASFRSSGGWGQIYVGNSTNWVDLGVNDNVGYVSTRFAGDLHFRTNLTTRMTISDASGNVGIGLTSPSVPLEVFNPALNSTVGKFTSAGIWGEMQIGTANALINLGANDQLNYGYIGTSNSNDFIIRTDNSPKLTIDGPTGSVGIGTTSPQAPLHVIGSSGNNTGTNVRYFNDATANIASYPNWPGQATIYAEGNICATESFIAGQSFNFSDARIKHIIGRSDGAADLDRLNRIEITRYTHIDTLAKGQAVQTKVIAQQLEGVMPEAVSLTREFIPDVMQVAEQLNFQENENLLTITLPRPHRLQAGEHIKCMDEKGQELIVGVLAVPNENSLLFKLDRRPSLLFVYGKRVDDFHIVDYDAIAMLNVSATQELARRLAASEQSAGQLQAEVEALKAKLSEMEALKKQMARLEAMLAGQ